MNLTKREVAIALDCMNEVHRLHPWSDFTRDGEKPNPYKRLHRKLRRAATSGPRKTKETQ
jgi:hypothetical protein